MLIIPAIEVSNKTFFRTIQGEPGHESLYRTLNATPKELIRLWRKENARTIQITDRDGYSDPSCTTNRELVLKLANSVDIPISLLTRCESAEDYAFYLDNGIYRIVLSRFARKHPQDTKALLKQYSASRVIAGMRCNDESVVGHEGMPTMQQLEFVNYAQSLGFKRIQYTDVEWEGTLTGHDVQNIIDIASSTSMRMTVAGGIGGYTDLKSLQQCEQHGVDSVVIGRALHENKFPCQKIWRMAEKVALSAQNEKKPS